jgi:hypothetical protein
MECLLENSESKADRRLPAAPDFRGRRFFPGIMTGERIDGRKFHGRQQAAGETTHTILHIDTEL